MCSKTDARAKIVIIADLPFAEFGRKIFKFLRSYNPVKTQTNFKISPANARKFLTF